MNEVTPKTKYTKEVVLESSLGGAGGCKSSISNLDGLDSTKDELTYELSSDPSAAKERVKMMKELGLDANPNDKGEASVLKKRSKAVSHSPDLVEDLKSPIS